jgi:hypothetical protein
MWSEARSTAGRRAPSMPPRNPRISPCSVAADAAAPRPRGGSRAAARTPPPGRGGLPDVERGDVEAEHVAWRSSRRIAPCATCAEPTPSRTSSRSARSSCGSRSPARGRAGRACRTADARRKPSFVRSGSPLAVDAAEHGRRRQVRLVAGRRRLELGRHAHLPARVGEALREPVDPGAQEAQGRAAVEEGIGEDRIECATRSSHVPGPGVQRRRPTVLPVRPARRATRAPALPRRPRRRPSRSGHSRAPGGKRARRPVCGAARRPW